MSDDEKKAPTAGEQVRTSNSTNSKSRRCCSQCGASAVFDGRDEYLTCGCDSRGTWVNDGRGGYFETSAHIVSRPDDDDGRDPDDYYKYPQYDDWGNR